MEYKNSQSLPAKKMIFRDHMLDSFVDNGYRMIRGMLRGSATSNFEFSKPYFINILQIFNPKYMRRLVFVFSCFISVSCSEPTKISNSLNQEQEEFQKKALYVYLNDSLTYDFINSYYLNRLDILETGRKLFVHPINKPKFVYRPAADSKKNIISLPEPIVTDLNFTWDSNRIKNTKIINSYDINDLHQSTSSSVSFKKKFGKGYVCISRPAYNSHTKRIIIREWIENGSSCGTDREQMLSYRLTKNGRWTGN